MAFDFYDNNGHVITVSIYQGENGTISWRGLYAGEPAPTFFNINDFITDDMQIISNPLSYLLQDRTIAEAEAYIATIKNDINFVWGNIYEGGLGVYKTSANTLGISLFGGRGIKKSDNNIVRYWGLPFYTNQNIVYWQGAQMCILEGKNLDQTPNYAIFYPNVQQGTQGVVRQCSPVPEYNNPLNPSQITSVNWERSETYYRLDETLVDSTYLVVQPLNPSIESYTRPYLAACYDDMYNTQTWSDFGDDTNYDMSGSWFGGDANEAEVDPNQSSGYTTTGGGYGTPSNNSDEVDFPPSEQYSNDVYNSGFVTAYLPTKDEIKALNDYLFTGITEAASLVIKRILTNPMDFIISLGLIHYTPNTLSEEEIQFCGLGTGVFAHPVETQFYEMNCGTIKIEEQFNSFLDYPHSKVWLYLPYCGIYPLKTSDVMNSTIMLKYVIDNFTGNCIAMVKVSRNRRCEGDTINLNSILYRYTGNVMTQVPLTSTDWTSFVNGAIQAFNGIVGGATSGNIVGGLGSVASGVLSMHPDVIRAGSVHTDFGFMDEHRPYLILEKPIQAIPQQFYDYRGYVSNITMKLANCSKFTKVSESTIWTNNIKCTDDEMEEIKQLCYEGVWI